MFGRLVGWLVGRLHVWEAWLVRKLVGRLVGRLHVCLQRVTG